MVATGEQSPDAESVGLAKRPVRRRRGKGKSRWTFSVALAVGVHAAALLVLRTPPIEVGDENARKTVIEWLGPQAATSETLIGEQLALFDNAPLFLPTPWNYAVVEGPAVDSRAPTDFFPAYRSNFFFETDRSPSGVMEMPPSVESSLDAAREFQWPYLSVFGRVDRAPLELPPRVARIEVRSVETGQVVFSASVDAESSPMAVDWPDWRPFTLLFDVNQMGTVGEPLVAPPGSQAEAVDAFFRGFVKNGLQLSLLLPPGYYSATVGP